MKTNKKIQLFISKKSWIESNALEQLRLTADLPGIPHAAGMPDLHAGKGCPVGAAGDIAENPGQGGPIRGEEKKPGAA